MNRYYRLIVIILLFSLTAGLLSGCRGEELLVLRFPLEAEPLQLDPQVASDRASVTVLTELFEGLTVLGPDGSAIPAAADWTLSEDQLIYTFTLREAVWSDGGPVTAADFLFAFKRLLSPGTHSVHAAKLFEITGAEEFWRGEGDFSEAGIKAIGSKTLTICLSAPNEDFPRKLAASPFFPCNHAFFEQTGGRYGLETEYLIGNGPYQLTGWSHGERITLKKSPEYRGEAEILPDEVRFYMDADGDPLDLLTSGQLSAAEITAEQAAEPPTGIRVERMNDRIRYLWINNALPLFQSEKLRQSLRDGLEWEILNRQLDGKTAKPAEGYLPPDTTLDGVIYRTGANRLSFTTDSAAGDRFREGLRETGISQPAIALLCADDRASVEYAQYIAQSWQKNLQLFVTLESLAPDVLAARLLVGNYQLAVFPLTTAGDTAAAGLSVFAGTAGEGNLAHYTDDAFIAGCAMLRGGGDTREAAEEWERRLYEACPAVPLAFETRYFGISEKLDGLRIHPFNGGSYGSPYDFYQTEKK